MRCGSGFTQIALLLAVLLGTGAASGADWAEQRRALLQEVQGELIELAISDDLAALSPAVLGAMDRVPRHEFVPERQRNAAYENRPLPIGHGQTISQPLIVALMTQLLQLQPGDRVFELGTGSGYQAAVLAEMGAVVYSMEVIEPLGTTAAARLNRLGYRDIRVQVGDGYHGWPEGAPFDAIIVTAAGDHIPPPLLAQLKPGGRMVIPVGGQFLAQQLVLVTRDDDGTLHTRNILPVAFVRLTGEH